MEYDISKSFKFKIRCVAFFQNKIRHVSEFFVQNLTRCSSLRSKCEQTRNFHFKIWRVVKCLGQNLTGCVLLISKLMRCLFHQFRVWHNVKFLTRYLTRRKMSFSKIWCLVNFYFQNLMRFFPWIQHLTRCIFLYSKSDMSECKNTKSNALSFLNSKSDAVKFSSIQNLTRCKISTQNLTPFLAKSDALYCFAFKHWHVKKILFGNLMCWLFLNTESGTLYNYQVEIWCLVLFVSKSDALFSFQFEIWHLINFSSGTFVLKKNENCKNWRFHGLKERNVILKCNCLWNTRCRSVSISKPDALYFFSVWNLTPFKNVNAKSDVL